MRTLKKNLWGRLWTNATVFRLISFSYSSKSHSAPGFQVKLAVCMFHTMTELWTAEVQSHVTKYATGPQLNITIEFRSFPSYWQLRLWFKIGKENKDLRKRFWFYIDTLFISRWCSMILMISFPLLTRDILYRSKVIYARHFFDTNMYVQLDSKYDLLHL